MTDRPSVYAIGEILSRLDVMSREIPGVISSEDPECLHRMRVASRRLRAALGLLGEQAGMEDARGFFKLIRSVTRRLGEARDIDVQVLWLGEFVKSRAKNEMPGVERLILRLVQSRAKKQPAITRLLMNLSDGALMSDARTKLESARIDLDMKGTGDGAGDVERAVKVIGLQIESMMRHSVFLSSPEASDAHHRLRIEIKRLRYAIEIYRGLYSDTEGLDRCICALKKLQDALGELHDADVWIAAVPELMEREKKYTARYYGSERPFARLAAGYRAIASDRSAFRASQYGTALDLWRSTAEQNTWGDLRVLLYEAYRNEAARWP
ncbi:MAG: CHAD domain-containing protein [Synergistaceae bacterium]|jgi:CHAD domain-containing protein|nr:CHAD domain-containing protein [Synergistaceae bacterium]